MNNLTVENHHLDFKLIHEQVGNNPTQEIVTKNIVQTKIMLTHCHSKSCNFNGSMSFSYKYLNYL